MDMPLTRSGSDDLPRLAIQSLMAAGGGALVGWLLWLGASTHLRHACLVLDTPYLPLCATAAPEADAEQLGRRLSRNPGDSAAWASLLTAQSGPTQEKLLPLVASVFPSDPNVMRLQTSDALARNDLERAVTLLVQMTEHRIGDAEPPQALARLIAEGKGAALVRPHLTAGSQWLPRVIQAVSALKLPLEPLFPLLAEAAAKRIVPQETVQSFVRSLKAERKWSDAYGLWAAQQRQPVPVLFNASFDQPFQQDGFDWEVTRTPPSRAGALVTQQTERGHGQVLEIQYTGRAVPTPVIRQYLFASPGRYVLYGQYMTSKLRTEQGLAWAVRCIQEGPHALAGRSEALHDTSRVWKSFRFEVEVPQNCGMVAALQLETYAPFEAAAGLKGTVSFDRLELKRLEP